MQVLVPDWVLTPEGMRPETCVVVHDGSIVELRSGKRHPDLDNALRIELPGRVLLPGFVNAHSHAFQRAFRGRVQWRSGDRDDFWSWRDAMYRVAVGLTPEGVQAVSRLAFLEMVEAGITTVGEFHYLHHQVDGTPYADPDELARRVVVAAAEVGLRIVLLRVMYGRAGAGRPLSPAQLRFGDAGPDDALGAAERLREAGVRVGLAPHSTRAVPAEWLSAVAHFDGPIHAHVSEQPAENEAALAEHGCSPLAVFERAGLLHDRFTAVHLTFPQQGDVDRMVAAGARVAACPTTEMDLGDGFLPLDARERLPVCLGSDSHASIEPMWEARSLELHARALAGRRNVLAPVGERDGLARRLIDAASVVGDRALGGGGRGLAAGAPADLVAVDLDRPAAYGVPPLEAVVFNSGPDWVSDVWVGGRRVVEAGRHPDREAILAATAPHIADG